jgi:hypothetical protein
MMNPKQLTSFAADSLDPVRTLASRGQAPAYPGAVRDSGGKWCEPFAWYDQSTCLWRTWQLSLAGGWEQFSETWPRAGMTRSGIAYRRQPLVPLTSETESGLLPTPSASDPQLERRVKVAKRTYRTRSGSVRSAREDGTSSNLGLAAIAGGPINPAWDEWIMGYPIGWTALEP